MFDRASKDKYHKFETGFKTIVDNPVFRSFRPEELQQIVAGAQVIDWKEIENNAKVRLLEIRIQSLFDFKIE